MILTPEQRAFLADARTATLATVDSAGRPRLVPICFVVVDEDGVPTIVSPIDEKPKAVADVRALARVRDILARPDVTVLVDRWSEDWSELAWLRCQGRAAIVEPRAVDGARDTLIDTLRAKYPQYQHHDLASRPMIRIEIARATNWGALSTDVG